MNIISTIYGLFVLLDTDSNPDHFKDIRPKNGYSTDRKSGSRFIGIQIQVCAMETVSVQYNVAIWFGIQI